MNPHNDQRESFFPSQIPKRRSGEDGLFPASGMHSAEALDWRVHMFSCFLEGLMMKYRYTASERRLIRHILRGSTYAEIARAEYMSVSKVKKMALRIFRHAGYTNRPSFERAMRWSLLRFEGLCRIRDYPEA